MVDSVVFDAEKLLMSNSCEIKWAIDNNSSNNKKIITSLKMRSTKGPPFFHSARASLTTVPVATP